MTNADVIRQMTDDELYKFLQAFETGDIDYSLTFCSLCKDMDWDCDECFKRWLFNDAYDFNGLLKDKGINSGYVKDEPQKKYPTEWCEDCNLWREDNCMGVAQCKANMEAVMKIYEASKDEPQTEKLLLDIAFEMELAKCKTKHKGCENCDMNCAWRDEQSGKE